MIENIKLYVNNAWFLKRNEIINTFKCTEKLMLKGALIARWNYSIRKVKIGRLTVLTERLFIINEKDLGEGK